MKRYNVIIAGPDGAGKTTAVQSVSDGGKASSTMLGGMPVDYGIVNLSPTEQAHLYGISGEGSFDPIGDVLIQSASGLLVMLDNRRNNPFRDLKRHTAKFPHLFASQQVVVGITHCDHTRTEPLERYRQWAQDNLPIAVELVPVDARNQADILALLTQVLASCRQPQPPVDLAPLPPLVTEVVTQAVAPPEQSDTPPPDKKLLKKLWNMVYLE
ncbi:MAG: hypothetical protein KJ914_03865 [Gammaproteobacteria bacterium]|nr:hypothetical protein [Gammaproteobacteria bacterium]MBU1722525.1 hypothetical protein [Gammaproteobacteria bacterium]MBU2004426.1 hypothetical protein [Gammaproteobacteria bacterium]